MLVNAKTPHEFVLATLTRYECPLTRYAQRLLNGDCEAARDVVQHTFLRLCEQQPFELEHKLAPWLYTVCRNRVFDLLRKQKTEPTGEPDLADQIPGREIDPADWLESNDMMLTIQRVIDELPPAERETADLWSQGFSNREMAQITGKTNGTIRVTLHRAIKQLKQHPAVSILRDNEKQNDVSPDTGDFRPRPYRATKS